MPNLEDKFQACDLLIAGGGPAGYDAALGAARAGLSVCLAEPGQLGGTCLNRGCIPTKIFLGATQAVAELRGQEKMRLASGDIHIDLASLQTRKERHLAATRKAMQAELAKLKVDLREASLAGLSQASAWLDGPSGRQEMSFKHCILATGTRPGFFPGLAPDGECVLDSDAALNLSELPASLLVVGSGAVGLELAQFFARLGSQVTLVEAAARIAPTEDPEVSKVLGQILSRQGFKLEVGQKALSLVTHEGQAKLILQDGRELRAAKALLAVGRLPNSQGLGLEGLGCTLFGPGFLRVNEHLQAAERIYALGDLNGLSLYAHSASHQAAYAVRRILGQTGKSYQSPPVPSCIYGEPQVLRLGLTAEEIKAQGRAAKVSRSQLIANPIAQAHAATAGFVKIVWDEEERVAGITAVGCGVAGLASLAGIAVAEAWERDAERKIIFAHPSLDEALAAALLAPLELV